jgi:cytochrome P450
MIADIVGIPVDDRGYLFGLATRFLRSEGSVTDDEYLAVQLEMFEYAQQLGREKRANPRDDVWTLLSTIEVESDGDGPTRLSEIELDFFFILLTLAGSETTRDAISLGLLALLEHPDQLQLLRDEPDVMPTAVEEILRWSSPVSYFARRATRDTEVAGVPVKAADRVTLWYASANRDEAVFDDPFRFDIRRTPNHHVAFGGGGPHFCLGANLARREITIFFEELLARVREIEVTGPVSYNALGIYNPILVAASEIPVQLR